jgi:hypothetical protein
LERKIGKSGGRHHGKSDRNESAYTFSGGKQRGNQGKNNSMGENPNQNVNGNFKGKEVREMKVRGSLEVIVGIVECKCTGKMISLPRSKEQYSMWE